MMRWWSKRGERPGPGPGKGPGPGAGLGPRPGPVGRRPVAVAVAAAVIAGAAGLILPFPITSCSGGGSPVSPGEAMVDLSLIIPELPPLPNDPYMRARELIDRGEVVEAEVLLSGIIEDEGDSSPISRYIRYHIAECRLALGDTPAAEELLAGIIEGPDLSIRSDATRVLIDLLADEGRFIEALREIGRATDSLDGDERLRMTIEEAEIHARSGDTIEAYRLLSRVVEDAGNPQVALLAIGRMNELDIAIPESDLARIAERAYDGGDFILSSNLYSRLIPLSEDSGRTRALYMYARSLERADLFSDAIAAYERLGAEAPDYMPATRLYREALSMKRIGRDEEGDRLLGRIIADYPRSSLVDDCLFKRAVHRDRRDRREEALELYSRLIDRYPRSGWADDAAWRTGMAALLDGEPEEARRLFTSALRRFPRSDFAPGMTYWTARTLDDEGDTPAAAEAYLAAANNPSSHYYRRRAADRLRGLGVAFTALSRDPAALDGWREIAEIDPADLLAAGPLDLPETSSPSRRAAAALLERGAVDEAAEEALRLSRGTESRREMLEASVLYAAGGRYREAMRRIEAMVRSMPEPLRPAEMPPIVSRLIFPPFYRPYIEDAARANGLPPLLIPAVIREESRFQADVASYAGAQGLMQIMPATASRVAASLGIDDHSTRRLLDPEYNIRLGSAYLADMLDRYDGRVYLALAAYNAGPGNADRWERESGGLDEDIFIERITFRETRNYVKRVLGSWWDYEEVYPDGRFSPGPNS